MSCTIGKFSHQTTNKEAGQLFFCNQHIFSIFFPNQTHSVRKHADDLKNNLENIVIPMFCSAEISKCILFVTWNHNSNTFTQLKQPI